MSKSLYFWWKVLKQAKWQLSLEVFLPKNQDQGFPTCNDAYHLCYERSCQVLLQIKSEACLIEKDLIVPSSRQIKYKTFSKWAGWKPRRHKNANNPPLLNFSFISHNYFVVKFSAISFVNHNSKNIFRTFYLILIVLCVYRLLP